MVVSQYILWLCCVCIFFFELFVEIYFCGRRAHWKNKNCKKKINFKSRTKKKKTFLTTQQVVKISYFDVWLSCCYILAGDETNGNRNAAADDELTIFFSGCTHVKFLLFFFIIWKMYIGMKFLFCISLQIFSTIR